MMNVVKMNENLFYTAEWMFEVQNQPKPFGMNKPAWNDRRDFAIFSLKSG